MKAQDASQLSAFAIYNNLIPGVKSYQDTSEPNLKKRNKRNKKRKEAIKKELEVAGIDSSSSSLIKINGSSTSKSALAGKSSSVQTAMKVKNIPALQPDVQSAETVVQNKKKNKKIKHKRKLNDTNSGEKKIAKLSTSNAHVGNLLPNPLAGLKAKKIEQLESLRKKDSSLNTLSQMNQSSGKLSSATKRQVQKKSASTSSKPLIVNTDTSVKPLTKKHKKKANSLPSSNQVEVEHQANISTQKEENGTECRKRKIKDDEVPIRSLLNYREIHDSHEHGKSLFQWLIFPTPVTKFMKHIWEKKPLHIKRSENSASYYKWILSSAKMDDVLRNNVLKYTQNVDITTYTNGVRETVSESLQGRVRPPVLWDYYNNGCSVRILNPQTYIKPLWRLNASLQEWLGSFVGANIYLTPPDSQGFAPHYDDIEAFILQVEGKKHWKLYRPRTPNEVLPRFSSQNFSEDKDNLGEPILDVVVEEGDLLYFPRGTIHQAKAADDSHSLHITLSCNQKNTWGDLLKEHLDKVLELSTATDVDFRRGLPTDYLSYMGIAHQESSDKTIREKRNEFQKTMKRLFEKLMKEPADYAADQMGKKFMWDSLPPYLTATEKKVTVAEDGEFMSDGKVLNRCEMDPDTEIKLIRQNCVRLVVEESSIRLYFSLENSLVYHEEEAQFVDIPPSAAPAIQHLITCYPAFTRIEDLPMKTNDLSEKVQVVSDLWEKCLLATKVPLETVDDCPDFNSEDAESVDEDLFDDTDLIDADLEEVSDCDEDEMDARDERNFFVGTDSDDENVLEDISLSDENNELEDVSGSEENNELEDVSICGDGETSSDEGLPVKLSQVKNKKKL